jgi:hypothetical protein
MNEATICHICQLKDEEEGEKDKSMLALDIEQIFTTSDKLLNPSPSPMNPGG